MYKSVTIEPRPNMERFSWIVKFRTNDMIDHERVFTTLDDAFTCAATWLVHGEMGAAVCPDCGCSH